MHELRHGSVGGSKAAIESTLQGAMPAGFGLVEGGISLARINDADSEWNHVLLMAQPRLASGDWGLISESIRTSSTQFALVILAKSDRSGPSNALIG